MATKRRADDAARRQVERQRGQMIDAVGLALAHMAAERRGLAGEYLDCLVEKGILTPDQAMFLMDGLVGP